MKDHKLSIFEHQHPEFTENIFEKYKRHKIERRAGTSILNAAKTSKGESMEQFMDGVLDSLGLNSRQADKEAEAASESADWDLGNIIKNHPSNPAYMESVHIIAVRASDNVIQFPTPPDSPNSPTEPDHHLSETG